MVARRRRRELFPPDRRLQARMAVTALLTPAVVLALAAAVVLYAPHRLFAGLAIATAVGTVVAVRERRSQESARVLPADERPELHAKVERLCVLADLPRPQIVVDDEAQPNSWIVDLPGARPKLHLTRGLLEALTPVELEAVIAHELAHVANRDATVMTIVGGPGAVLLEGGRAVSGRGGWWVLQIGALVAALIGTIAQVGTNALSRYREFAADAGAAALTGHPAALASALVKVSGGLSRLPTEDLRLAAGRNAFQLLPVGERSGRGLWAWLAGTRLGATHPSLERRLAALERLERRMASARPAPPADLGG